ncbi:probable peptide chain release factor C12orf65, mitochondrial [Contarinia nasturtii]|uniref:probable peptide chain release factor C12orf65, mitochondrial n=1 Tax=Contarinia nasturtii TaxID=265458 RepID=UPI0012D3FB9A|nr:probable peptide chain release factor C12orf65, mitochondrial [Contarinia nasturtii]
MIRVFFHPLCHQYNQVLPLKFIKHVYHTSNILSSKKSIDYSRVPVLDENDLQMQMVRGSGPGGQAVQKTNNCIVLKHIPTGIVVKCHKHRMALQNQKEARKLMITRLDNAMNGEQSVENQLKRLEMKKSSTSSWKQRKLNELKKEWKERENIE